MNIMKKILLLLPLIALCGLSLRAQTPETIRGTVLDKQSLEAVIGASVTVQGTTTGVVTDLNGKFELRASPGQTLQISYMGYKPQTVQLKDTQPVTVYLEEIDQELDEVVVIGYGVQKKSDVTGSISSVSGKDLTLAPVASPIQALQGKAAGVQIVQNTGAPGGATTIKIRGTGTVNDSDPLYVVDGFIVDDIEHINPNDIANMEILKDAASSSIYGARGANGVLLITTKQGESGKTQINFDSYWGVSSPWKTIPVMSIPDFALMRDYVESNQNFSAEGQLYYSKDPSGNLYYNEDIHHNLDSMMNAPGTPSNWWDAVTQTGIKQQYNLSVSGGNENHKFLVSGNYYDEKGIVKTSEYQRLSLRLNLLNKITDRIDLRTALLYTNDNRQVVPEGQDGVLKRTLNQRPVVYTYNAAGYWTDTGLPLAMLELNHNEVTNNRFDLNIDLTAKISKFLNYQFKISNYTNIYNHYRFNEVGKLEANFSMPNDRTKVIRNVFLTNKMEINNLLTFNFSNDRHSINGVAGQTIEMSDYETIDAERQGAPSNQSEFRYLSSAWFGDRTTGTLSEWSAIGYLGRINYEYGNRYLLQANFRADASSKFSESERWGFFPSVSAGWKFSSEEWLESFEPLSLGKIRAGWGRLGNNRIDEYARYTIISNEYNYSYGTGNHITQPGARATTLGNEHIRWEKTESYNLGLDLNFLDNRLSTTVEYFDKKTSDMLLRVPVTLAAGLNNAPMVNAGAVRNYGAELLFKYRDQIGKLKYEIGFNVSYIKNEVTSLGTGNEPIYGARLDEASIGDYVTRTEVGMPIGYFYGYVTDGIFQTPEEVEKSAQNDGFTFPGDFRFKDLNHDNKIDAEDRTYLGSPHPDFVFGVPLNFSYGNWDLTAFFQGQTGNKIFNVMEYYLNSAHGTGNCYENIRDLHWSGTYVASRSFWSANPGGTVPDLDPADNPRNFRASNFYVKDGSYLRLQTLQLNYNLPDGFVRKLSLAKASVYASAYNLLTVTKYNGFDPEVGKNPGSESNNLYMGVDHGNYPQARSFLFGLKLTF
ncbi:MAG: TonB-dependent receptor [Dysgonamonadaceae bacterium]|jgi:TonB-linked SusC/RagA family outer membrane protein|nr:TonB-dependent receptor [Dysgonamonadaceae bacterium]